MGPKPNLLTVTPYIKRVVGLPGSTIITSVTDLPENLKLQQLKFHDEKGKRVWNVPPGHFFAKGDASGVDSTTWGPLPFNNFWGIVVVKLPTKKS